MEQKSQAQEVEGTAADPAQGQGADEGTEEKDWKSLYEGAIKESRKWEKRSKASRAEIESLKAASEKQDQTFEERLAALEEGLITSQFGTAPKRQIGHNAIEPKKVWVHSPNNVSALFLFLAENGLAVFDDQDSSCPRIVEYPNCCRFQGVRIVLVHR